MQVGEPGWSWQLSSSPGTLALRVAQDLALAPLRLHPVEKLEAVATARLLLEAPVLALELVRAELGGHTSQGGRLGAVTGRVLERVDAELA